MFLGCGGRCCSRDRAVGGTLLNLFQSLSGATSCLSPARTTPFRRVCFGKGRIQANTSDPVYLLGTVSSSNHSSSLDCGECSCWTFFATAVMPHRRLLPELRQILHGLQVHPLEWQSNDNWACSILGSLASKYSSSMVAGLQNDIPCVL